VNLSSFFSDVEYRDANHYPRGFHNSQDFSEPEADILSIYGNVVTALVKGEIVPQNQEQKRLVEVMCGDRSPVFFIEKVFFKYFKLINGEAYEADKDKFVVIN